MRVTVIASGSKGNSLVIEFGTTRIAVDAGYGPRNLAKKYAAAGIAPESVHACIITHEHVDHARGALDARRKWGWTLAGTPQTLDSIGAIDPAENSAPMDYGTPLKFGDAQVTLIKVAHDAVAPAAILVEDCASGARVGIAYDLGAIPAGLAQAFALLDILVLEANHDMGMLRAGPYPLHLQDRIAGSHGHLSNFQSAEFARTVAHPGLRAVVLAHLSEQNNTPTAAREAVGRQLRRTNFRGKLGAANQDRSCTVGDAREVQLQLF
jgi:phosphoribosyl 1,2-cyclic phosphodiesterase